MHIDRIQVEQYRGIKNLDMRLCTPANDKNEINVLIGKNGSGKTTILQMISEWFTTKNRTLEFGTIHISNGIPVEAFEKIVNGEFTREHTTNLNNALKTLTENTNTLERLPQFIYLPAQIQFGTLGHHGRSEKSLKYEISVVIKDNLLDATEAYIKEFVIATESELSIADPSERSQAAIDEFNNAFVNLDLSTRLCKLDRHNLSTPLFSNVDGETFDINGLSDGEKQIYARAVGLMMLRPKNSVILVDEPELGLHPAWQYKIMQLYSSIGTGNQYIIATHSAQVLSSVHWSSIQVIERNKGKTNVYSLPGPPTGMDSSSVLSEVMGADFYHPELYDLKRKYRLLFESEEEDSVEGVELKNKLEELESNDSEFFQELRLIRKIRDKTNAQHSKGS